MAEGFFSKLRVDGLFRSRQNLNGMVDDAVTEHQTVDDDFFDGLTDALILSDMGRRGRSRVQTTGTREGREYPEPARCKEILKEILVSLLDVPKTPLKWSMVILMVGGQRRWKDHHDRQAGPAVSGVGPHDSVLRCGYLSRGGGGSAGHLGGSCSRCRWCGIRRAQTQPALCLTRCRQPKPARRICRIVDTAGRLHNKKNLMDEMEKMRRVIDREYPEATVRCLLVIDAATGQNGLQQFARSAKLPASTASYLPSWMAPPKAA